MQIDVIGAKLEIMLKGMEEAIIMVMSGALEPPEILLEC